MRDPKRINSFIKELKQLWLKHPDLRFVQLVGMIGSKDWFYTEDDVILKIIKGLRDD